MNLLLIYLGGVLLTGLFAFFVLVNFARNRFKADKTYVLIGIFAFFFLSNVLFTIYLLQNLGQNLPTS